MVKQVGDRGRFDEETLGHQIRDGEIPVMRESKSVAIDWLDRVMIGVQIGRGDSADMEGRRQVDSALRQGYLGMGLVRPKHYGASSGSPNVIVLARPTAD